MGPLKDMLEKYFSKIAQGGKNFVNLIAILIIGIVIMIAGGSLFGGNKKPAANISQSRNTNTQQIQNAEQVQNTAQTNTANADKDFGEKLEKRLEDILSQIDGVGKVSVMITFDSGSEIVPAFDGKTGETITEEKDTQGGNRKISQTEQENKLFTYNEQGGKQEPLILKELEPAVKGVIVAAEGASDITVKSNIYDGVKTVLGVQPHKVQIFQLKK